MKVVVNRRELELSDGATVTDLLTRLSLQGPYCLVERNGEPVLRARYDEERLAEGDRLVVAVPTAGG